MNKLTATLKNLIQYQCYNFTLANNMYRNVCNVKLYVYLYSQESNIVSHIRKELSK